MSYLESSGTSSLMDETWVSWFCSLNGNHVFCEVDKQFMEDSFNIFGLKQYINKDFNKVLFTILDQLDPEEAESEDLSRSAALLYGLIHARFIITANGLNAMQKKYLSGDFGECPRTLCNGQAVLPIGVSDEPKLGTYKLFCPKCRDLFNCSTSQRHIDGAYFGTTFPHIFLMTYEDLVPVAPQTTFVPRVFGFKIHASSNSLPRARVPTTSDIGSNSGSGGSDSQIDATLDNNNNNNNNSPKGTVSSRHAGGVNTTTRSNPTGGSGVSSGGTGVPPPSLSMFNNALIVDELDSRRTMANTGISGIGAGAGDTGGDSLRTDTGGVTSRAATTSGAGVTVSAGGHEGIESNSDLVGGSNHNQGRNGSNKDSNNGKEGAEFFGELIPSRTVHYSMAQNNTNRYVSPTSPQQQQHRLLLADMKHNGNNNSISSSGGYGGGGGGGVPIRSPVTGSTSNHHQQQPMEAQMQRSFTGNSNNQNNYNYYSGNSNSFNTRNYPDNGSTSNYQYPYQMGNRVEPPAPPQSEYPYYQQQQQQEGPTNYYQSSSSLLSPQQQQQLHQQQLQQQQQQEQQGHDHPRHPYSYSSGPAVDAAAATGTSTVGYQMHDQLQMFMRDGGSLSGKNSNYINMGNIYTAADIGNNNNNNNVNNTGGPSQQQTSTPSAAPYYTSAELAAAPIIMDKNSNNKSNDNNTASKKRKAGTNGSNSNSGVGSRSSNSSSTGRRTKKTTTTDSRGNAASDTGTNAMGNPGINIKPNNTGTSNRNKNKNDTSLGEEAMGGEGMGLRKSTSHSSIQDIVTHMFSVPIENEQEVSSPPKQKHP
mmetsp:Transcript_31627/g.52829  ORF Transcript_31627/g.52829 Transcript_31627/m.52829 type:complete len:814 (+) Transcript_31627:183-2624(+)